MEIDPSKPVLNSTIIVAFVASLITLLAAFGLPVTDAQTEAILAFIPASWVLGLAIYFAAKPRVEHETNRAVLETVNWLEHEADIDRGGIRRNVGMHYGLNRLNDYIRTRSLDNSVVV